MFCTSDAYANALLGWNNCLRSLCLSFWANNKYSLHLSMMNAWFQIEDMMDAKCTSTSKFSRGRCTVRSPWNNRGMIDILQSACISCFRQESYVPSEFLRATRPRLACLRVCSLSCSPASLAVACKVRIESKFRMFPGGKQVSFSAFFPIWKGWTRVKEQATCRK